VLWLDCAIFFANDLSQGAGVFMAQMIPIVMKVTLTGNVLC